MSFLKLLVNQLFIVTTVHTHTHTHVEFYYLVVFLYIPLPFWIQLIFTSPFKHLFYQIKNNNIHIMSSTPAVKQYKALGEEVWKSKVDKIVSYSSRTARVGFFYLLSFKINRMPNFSL